jgi:hypothetical protein
VWINKKRDQNQTQTTDIKFLISSAGRSYLLDKISEDIRGKIGDFKFE